jgi:hypothetical protein
MAAALAVATSASASLTVAFDNVSPAEVVNLQVVDTGSGIGSFGPGGVYAGIYTLTVDGVATPSFCIDVGRDSGTSSDYSYAALTSAPLSPSGPMGAGQVIALEKLWAAYYSPSLNSQDAAALQTAIWESLGDGTLGYTVTVSGNNAVTAEAANELASLPGLSAQAQLQALVSPSRQNYVVGSVVAVGQTDAPLPEPTTMIAGALLLLPFGASTLRLLRKNRAPKSWASPGGSGAVAESPARNLHTSHKAPTVCSRRRESAPSFGPENQRRLTSAATNHETSRLGVAASRRRPKLRGAPAGVSPKASKHVPWPRPPLIRFTCKSRAFSHVPIAHKHVPPVDRYVW